MIFNFTCSQKLLQTVNHGTNLRKLHCKHHAAVVQKLDSAIHRINSSPADK